MDLSSSTFAPHGEIPKRHLGEGEDLAPPLHWTGIPDRAVNLVLIVDNTDALDNAHPELPRPTKATVEHAMRGDVLPQAELVATYRKRRP